MKVSMARQTWRVPAVRRVLSSWGWLATALTAAAIHPPASFSQVVLPEVTNETRVHLKRVDTMLASGQQHEALDGLRRVMDGAGRTVIEVPSPHAAAGFRCYRPLHAACAMQLASWQATAPQAFARYRQQVDGVAQRWLALALDKGDEARLRDIVDEYFCSSAGDDALFWLGEFAFQRGDYSAARCAWERIHPSFRWASADPRFHRYVGLPAWLLLRDVDIDSQWSLISDAVTGNATAGRWLAAPDTDLDLATVRARLALASIMEGAHERSAIELRLLERIAPQARGRLGGRQANLVERLREIDAESRTWPAPFKGDDWPTFAGNPQRNRHASADIDVGGRPVWRTELPPQAWLDEGQRPSRLRIGEPASRMLSYHPVVVGGRVLVRTSDELPGIRAFDLHSGELLFATEAALPPAVTYDNRQGRTVPRFTLSAADGRLLICLRHRQAGAPDAGKRDRLVAIDLEAEGRLAFEVSLAEPAWPGDWTFVGTPVCDDAHLYIAVRRRDAFRSELHLACFDLRNGRRKWRQPICSAPTLNGAGEESSHHLLTLSAGVLYYNSHAGAVAAVDSRDGEIRWITRYPRIDSDRRAGQGDQDGDYRFRDLTPCLVEAGLVYVAPSDCSRLFALDAASGQLVWTTPEGIGGDVIHLLGVGSGSLIASGEGLYWFDAFNGRLKTQIGGRFQPSPGHGRPAPRGYGRGLLAGENVYWPTRGSIFVFEQNTIETEGGWQPVMVREIDLATRQAEGGNLVMVDGILLIASGDHLYAFNETGFPSHVAD